MFLYNKVGYSYIAHRIKQPILKLRIQIFTKFWTNKNKFYMPILYTYFFFFRQNS